VSESSPSARSLQVGGHILGVSHRHRALYKSEIRYNNFLTLAGIPLEIFEYKIGNCSALHWVVDQHQVTKDDEGNVIEDPNNYDDEEYMVRLIEKVVQVSVESVKIINSLPNLKLPAD
jgi:predicted helicase